MYELYAITTLHTNTKTYVFVFHYRFCAAIKPKSILAQLFIKLYVHAAFPTISTKMNMKKKSVDYLAVFFLLLLLLPFCLLRVPYKMHRLIYCTYSDDVRMYLRMIVWFVTRTYVLCEHSECLHCFILD